MCGIFGACLNPKVMSNKGMLKAAIAKFKMLGIYNVDRGKHSCGVFMDDTILKGVDKDKLFSDFIVGTHLPTPDDGGNYVMIGHTRMATGSSHTMDNAHPFIIDDNFVLAHNGIIRNVWTLCNKYKIDHKTTTVDSHGLAKLINQEGFSILNDYEGNAALLMSKVNEPNSLYIFRGMSRIIRDGEVKEERPLWTIKTEEGIYVSSMPTSLLAISDGTKDKLEEVEGNVVHKLTNGVVTRSKYAINRENSNLTYTVNPHGGVGQGMQASKVNGTTTAKSVMECTTNSRVGSHSSCSLAPQRFETKTIPVIWHEILPSRVNKYKGIKGVYYHMGRYWVCDDETTSMANGEYSISKKGVVRDSHSNYKEFTEYYFYHGILMKDEKNYKDAIADGTLKSPLYNFASMISRYTDMPVANSRNNIYTGCRNVSEYNLYRWYQNLNICSNTGFTPKFSDRNYIIKEGLLHTITGQTGYEKEMTINTETLGIERGASVELPKSTMVLLPPAPVSQTIIAYPPQDDVTDEACCTVDKLEDEVDLQRFFNVYNSLEHARSTLTQTELNAIRYYVADVMINEMGISPDFLDTIFDDTVEVQLNMFLNVCIENQTSITDQWDEKHYKDVFDYLLIAKENPGGEMYDDTPGEIFVGEKALDLTESCDISCNTSTFEQELNTVAQAKVEEDIKNFDNKLRIVKEDEENIMDYAISQEQANFPEALENVDIEETTADQELVFAVKDAYDYSLDIRGFADELMSQDDSDYAQEVASIIYKTIDPFTKQLRTITEQYRNKQAMEVLEYMYSLDEIKQK